MPDLLALSTTSPTTCPGGTSGEGCGTSPGGRRSTGGRHPAVAAHTIKTERHKAGTVIAVPSSLLLPTVLLKRLVQEVQQEPLSPGKNRKISQSATQRCPDALSRGTQRVRIRNRNLFPRLRPRLVDEILQGSAGRGDVTRVSCSQCVI